MSNEDWRILLKRLIHDVIRNKRITEFEETMQEFSCILKRNNGEIIEESVCYIMEKAENSNSEYRYFLLKIVDYYVFQCVKFRKTVFENARTFLDLFCETNPQYNPLPGDKKHVKMLKLETMQIVKKWESKFIHDPLLQQIVDFLKTSKAVDYEGMNCEQEAIRERTEKRNKRKNLFIKMLSNVIREQFDNISNTLNFLLEEIRNFFEMLLPNMTISLEYLKYEPVSQSYGINDMYFLKFARIEDTRNSKILKQTFSDFRKLLDAQTKKLTRISHQVSREIRKDMDCSTKDLNNLKLEISQKRRLLKELEEILPQKQNSDEFIDVEPITADDILIARYSLKNHVIPELPNEPSTSKAVPKACEIPKVDFGLDLKYWGESDEKRGMVRIPKNNSDCHRFWRAPDDDTISGTVSNSIYTQRIFPFIGEAPKIEKVCRAPLSDGSLCPRMDYKRCPIHGTIVDRDGEGRAKSQKDLEITRKEEDARNKVYNDKIAREIELQTGIQLTGKQRKGSFKRKNQKSKNHGEEVRKRLEKKLLNPQTISRVSKVQDEVRKSTIGKKFGHQFSHL